MFASDLVLDDASGDDVTYRLRSQNANGSERIDIATNLRQPAILAIRHNSTGKGDGQVDRHNVTISRTYVTATGKPVVVSGSFTLAVPRDVVVTDQICFDLTANIMDFLANGALTTVLSDTSAISSLLRGES